METQQHVMLRWSAYEHEHVERGSDWFWALGIIAVCGAAISVLFHDSLFGLLIIVAAVSFALIARNAPPLSTFEISGRGVRINGVLHRYDEIISFWVEDEHHRGSPLLLIDTIKFLSPNFIIPIEGVDPHLVRTLLKAHAKEVPMKEPLSYRIVEFFGL